MRAHVLVGAPASSRRPPGSTNFGTNVAIATPPLAGSRSSTSSGMLRGWSQTARAEECEKITGAALTRSASRMVSAATCERSTSMPAAVHLPDDLLAEGATGRRRRGSSVAESAQAMLSLWVSVM